ncbi:hypothetical protein [Bradyrhizobium pachyrhizi]|uniref:glycine-rich domain-containing protein n=1 Tax=Bradyrhizobium pachyrhizi TaxID=280333 RepID=UPI0009E5FC65|nr:hypothetical protein [Bradyrhizobium pachyrhizi]
MASSFLDVCRFTASAGGTGDWSVAAAVTGYQAMNSAGGVNGATYSYRAESADLSQWEVGFGTYTPGVETLSRTTVLFNSAGTTAKINFSAAPQVAVVALAEDLVFVRTVKVQKFTASGTYTPSAGMIYCVIECMGGGGAGGGSASNSSFLVSGGGGGAGSYARKIATAADIGASKTVTIGAGGTGATGNTGGNGGDTSVGSLCIGKGGTGGNFGSSAAFGSGGAGGVAGTGDVTLPGASGGYGAYQSGTNAGFVVPSGMGGVSQFGGGGVQTVAVSTSFSAGVASGGFGGGGSGGMSSFSSTSTAGGAGAPGIVVVTEFCTK